MVISSSMRRTSRAAQSRTLQATPNSFIPVIRSRISASFRSGIGTTSTTRIGLPIATQSRRNRDRKRLGFPQSGIRIFRWRLPGARMPESACRTGLRRSTCNPPKITLTMNNKVWIFGLISTCALSVENVPGLPPFAVTAIRCIAVLGAALAGYHYPSPPGAAGKPVAIPVALALTLVAACTGCRFVGFGVSVSSPAFGALSLSVDGGAIGSHPPRVNAADASLATSAVPPTNTPTR